MAEVSKYETGILKIYIAKGTHYLLRNQDLYFPISEDPEMMHIEIKIQYNHIYPRDNYYFRPAYCSLALFTSDVDCVDDSGSILKPIIMNKRRENLRFLIYQKLEIENIIFDSIDSVILHEFDYEDCLNTEEICCKYDSGSDSIVNLDGGSSYNCEDQYLPRTSCIYPEGFATFQMAYSDQNLLVDPNLLVLTGVEFYNFLFNSNALIAVNVYGGQIEITDCVFQRFASCGAIISNYFIPEYASASVSFPSAQSVESPLQDLIDLYSDDSDSFVKVNSELHQDFITSEDGEGFPNCNNPILNENCFSLVIKTSTFEQMDFLAPKTSDLVFVPSDGLIYRGSVLNLNEFHGDIRIEDSIFRNNYINLDTCIEDDESWFEYLGIDSIYGSKTDAQINSMINVVSHNFDFLFIKNTVSNNSGIKGPIYITRSDNTPDGKLNLNFNIK